MSDRPGSGRPPRVAGLRRRSEPAVAGAPEPTTPAAPVEAATVPDAPAAEPAPFAPPVDTPPVDLATADAVGVTHRDDGVAEPQDDVLEDDDRRPWRPGGLLLAGIAAVLVLLVVAATLLTLTLRTQDAVQAARVDALAAARDAVPKLLSYDYQKLDADFAAAKAVTTGDFAAQYAKTSETVVRPLAVEVKGVVQATVVGSGVIEAEPDSVRLVLFVNQATTSTKVDGTKLDRNRVTVTMAKVGDRWLVSAVQAL